MSNKRIIRDPATPVVSDGDSYYNPKITLRLHSIGDHDNKKLSVSVTLHHWQIKNMLSEIRDLTAKQAERLREHAKIIEEQVK